jgi:hypothetical protein
VQLLPGRHSPSLLHELCHSFLAQALS